MITAKTKMLGLGNSDRYVDLRCLCEDEAFARELLLSNSFSSSGEIKE